MTQATEIMYSASNADAACKMAEEMTNIVDQNWECEATLYTFTDESVLVVTGCQLNAFDNMAAALQDLNG
jgi:hypothetical protein